MVRRKKVLLGTPTYDGKAYCLEYWIETVKAIQKHSKCDILIVDNSKTSSYANKIKKHGLKVLRSKHYKDSPLRSLKEAQEKLFKYTIKNGYDYLFSLEQDVFCSKDIIEKLLNTRKKIKDSEAVVGAPYGMYAISESKPPYLYMDRLVNVATKRAYNKRMKRKIQINMTEKEIKRKKKVFRAYNVAFGCTLIDVSILKKIKLDYTQTTNRPSDAFFALECYKKNIPMYANPVLYKDTNHIHGVVNHRPWWAR